MKNRAKRKHRAAHMPPRVKHVTCDERGYPPDSELERHPPHCGCYFYATRKRRRTPNQAYLRPLLDEVVSDVLGRPIHRIEVMRVVYASTCPARWSVATGKWPRDHYLAVSWRRVVAGEADAS